MAKAGGVGYRPGGSTACRLRTRRVSCEKRTAIASAHVGLSSGAGTSTANEPGPRRNDDRRPLVDERFAAARAALGRTPRLDRTRSHMPPLT